MDDNRIKGTVNTAEGKLKKAAGQITDDTGLEAEGAAGELAGRAQQAVGRAKEAARDYLDTAADGAEELGAAVNRTWERGRSYVEDRLDMDGRELVERGRGAVEANPLVSLLIAGAVGFGLALLLQGQRKPEYPSTHYRHIPRR